ncbi:MarR family winged helix-turn-helix transcriptional regulator [Agromyces humatus]|uniref:MarR family winged helix-turn-helix transcriptional regulator n=1 Tax=Agromyces humatus TaxID=279573 RepID=UPI001E3CE03A|nr:MarR family transcriptional regulator [Agromyces humatus]
MLESVTLLGQTIAAGPRVPFRGRDLTRTQMQALFTLAHDRQRVTPGRLATVLGVTAGAVTQLIDGLRGQGLVDTEPNPDDARSRVIRLTADAAGEVEQFERAAVERLLPRFASVSDDELIALARTLSRITE